MEVNDREQEIRSIAYGLWEQEGRPEGRDKEHYFKAEAIWRLQHEARRVVTEPEKAQATPSKGRGRRKKPA